jgi:hypothetical protein
MLRSAAVISILLAALSQAWAKSPTVKITISGGTLAHEIEVIDPHILDLSNVWGGAFLDASTKSAVAPVRAVTTYEVWFYIKSGDNGLQRRYVLYYSPGLGKEKGLIYLPGRGQPWYWLNVSAILRDGKDGKWNHASTSWEELIASAISNAETAR